MLVLLHANPFPNLGIFPSSYYRNSWTVGRWRSTSLLPRCVFAPGRRDLVSVEGCGRGISLAEPLNRRFLAVTTSFLGAESYRGETFPLEGGPARQCLLGCRFRVVHAVGSSDGEKRTQTDRERTARSRDDRALPYPVCRTEGADALRIQVNRAPSYSHSATYMRAVDRTLERELSEGNGDLSDCSSRLRAFPFWK